jgi:hypothetical protein
VDGAGCTDDDTDTGVVRDDEGGGGASSPLHEAANSVVPNTRPTTTARTFRVAAAFGTTASVDTIRTPGRHDVELNGPTVPGKNS